MEGNEHFFGAKRKPTRSPNYFFNVHACGQFRYGFEYAARKGKSLVNGDFLFFFFLLLFDHDKSKVKCNSMIEVKRKLLNRFLSHRNYRAVEILVISLILSVFLHVSLFVRTNISFTSQLH